MLLGGSHRTLPCSRLAKRVRWQSGLCYIHAPSILLKYGACKIRLSSFSPLGSRQLSVADPRTRTPTSTYRRRTMALCANSDTTVCQDPPPPQYVVLILPYARIMFGRDDCNSEDSCVFIGRSITGACVPRDPSILHKVCVSAYCSLDSEKSRLDVSSEQINAHAHRAIGSKGRCGAWTLLAFESWTSALG